MREGAMASSETPFNEWNIDAAVRCCCVGFPAAVIFESFDRNDKVLHLKDNSPSSCPTLLLPAHIHPLFLRTRTSTL